MKILIVASHLEPMEGWGTEALNSVRGLRKRGHDVRALVHRPYEHDSCVQYADLPEPLTMLRSPLAWLKTAAALHKRLHEWKPNIVHILTEPYALAIPFIPRRMRPALVLTANGTYSLVPLASGMTRWLMKRVYKQSACVLAISRYTEWRVLTELHERDPRLAEKVRRKLHVWTLGIEHPKHLPPRRKHDVKQMLFVGALKPRKGIGEIIEACGEFRKISSIPFHLNLIGAAPENAYIRQLLKRVVELQLESCVTFRGHVSDEDLTQAYADADLFLMLSKPDGQHFEGYGLVFLEANARGIPVIGPVNSGCVDAIADGRSGYLVDPEDARMTAERMQWILQEHCIQPSACRAWAEEHNIERQAQELDEHYRRALRLS